MMGSQLGGAPVHWPPSTHCLTVRVQRDNQHSSTSAYLVLFPERRNPWWQTTMTDEPYLNDFLLAETWTRPLSGETGTLQFISAMNVCLNTDHSTLHISASDLTDTGGEHPLSPASLLASPLPITDQCESFPAFELRRRSVFYWYHCINFFLNQDIHVFLRIWIMKLKFSHDYDKWNARFLRWQHSPGLAPPAHRMSGALKW